ncbi:MAG TPA: DnaJ C-terminal domain-containing protein [Burkholderiaceae bacterium]|nr:DnaJ C-terminal domain-containing protein [Burkholderiaceae bacterium]
MIPDNAYAELGLAPGASDDEVKTAWRRLASQWHPDRNRSAAAIGRMQRINQAIEQIRQFDGGQAARDESNETPAGDADAAGSQAQVRTISRKVKLTLEEAAAGCVKALRGKLIDRCAPCAGTGFCVIGGACTECKGRGSVRQPAWFGWSGASTRCTACGGDGVARQGCDACSASGKLPPREYRINVRIPHGVRDGDLLHVGQRRQSSGHPAVQLNLRVEVLPHALFELDADGTIRCEVPVDGFAWIANRSIDVPTLTGMQGLQLSRDCLSYRLGGQGFPKERRGPCGDHLVELAPIFPERLGTDQEILLDQLIAASSGPGGSAAATRLGDWRRALQSWELGRTPRGR